MAKQPCELCVLNIATRGDVASSFASMADEFRSTSYEQLGRLAEEVAASHREQQQAEQLAYEAGFHVSGCPYGRLLRQDQEQPSNVPMADDAAALAEQDEASQ